MSKVVRLGVNVDHVATLRQARGTVYPDVLEAAMLCVKAGAGGITAHLREDRRHVQDADVYVLKENIGVPLNLEMANEPEIVGIALDLCPPEVCIVPEKREELTTEGGLDAVGNRDTLADTIVAMQAKNIEVSLFIDPDPDQINMASELGAPCIELHTGTYCDSMGDAAVAELERLIRGSELAHELGIKVNAGHGINLDNIDGIMKVPHLDTLNIGHSIICRAVFVGIEGAVAEMQGRMV